MANNVNGSLEAVDCRIQNVTNEMAKRNKRNGGWMCRGTASCTNWTSSGHLQRCSMSNTTTTSKIRDIYPSML